MTVKHCGDNGCSTCEQCEQAIRADERAKILAERRAAGEIILNAEDWTKLEQWMEDEPAPTDALKALFADRCDTHHAQGACPTPPCRRRDTIPGKTP